MVGMGIRGAWPRARRRRGNKPIRLTTAYLCHDTKCDKQAHLREMCEPCHLIFDLRCRQLGLRREASVRFARQFERIADLAPGVTFAWELPKAIKRMGEELVKASRDPAKRDWVRVLRLKLLDLQRKDRQRLRELLARAAA